MKQTRRLKIGRRKCSLRPARQSFGEDQQQHFYPGMTFLRLALDGFSTKALRPLQKEQACVASNRLPSTEKEMVGHSSLLPCFICGRV